MLTNPNADAFASERSDGLTKREYFAAMAMQGLLAGDSYSTLDIAKLAVDQADRLINELNRSAK